ncbi:MAPEG family protein [uncultured Erythrobacter sp.]|uniref:MAPEG family protein n=1 Tax=uncultured Erythrobacter sp. TaxID=263913 RepID=UPI00260BB647|nr:MAPEG family protein [uncultured Erythrobacter sp.]
MSLSITAVTAAVLALLLLVTAIETVSKRLKLKAAFGDADDPGLIAAMRSHGNLSEHAPIVLIMLGLLEFGGANSTLLISIAGAFIVGRFAHVIGLHQRSEPGKAPLARQIGVILTWLTLLALAILLLVGVFVN